jgi:hypothetical protein
VKPASLGKITSADPQKQKVIVKMEPFGTESGWLPCLFGGSTDLVGKDCLVIPCHNTFGQAVVIPYPFHTPLITELTSASPLSVTIAGKTVTCQTTVALSGTDVGRSVLVVPITNGFVISGVVQ